MKNTQYPLNPKGNEPTFPNNMSDLVKTEETRIIETLIEARAIINKGDIKEVKADSDLELLNILNKSDIHSITSHNTIYEDLLRVYLDSVEDNLVQKREMKDDFFKLSCRIMSTVTILMILSTFLPFISILFGECLSVAACVPLISSLASFFAVFIIIPKIIAKHLFNDNDENIMTNIVKDIQKYDKYIRNALMKIDNPNDEDAKKEDVDKKNPHD